MTIVVTGSAGHLGEGLMRTLRAAGRDAIGLDIKASPFTDRVGSVTDRDVVRDVLRGASSVIHAATLHKPHVVTHAHQQFIDTNVSGTLCLLECAVEAKVGCFVFTSTTSTFGTALNPAPGEPAAWITEGVVPVPKNIYGATKLGAEHLCEMFAHKKRLPVVVLRTSRFFPEEDDSASVRQRFSLDNAQLNELLYRRVDLDDLVQAHLLALEHAARLGFGRFIVSAPSPFRHEHLATLRRHPWDVVRGLFPDAQSIYGDRGWSMFDELDRVYVSQSAVESLGWRPRYDYAHALAHVAAGRDFRSPLAVAVGRKGYHDVAFENGPYPVEQVPDRR
ncbi:MULTISPECIES: NAD-dependent epimerase/dehydratase family protein [Dyella]|uniref:NAD(P)-dependent oxidoreductase n=2 Tax=Dyella TaxID=231454 RepID=A0A4R0Z4U3_9GAMM|nr:MULTISPECIES: NAD(P)-dependent oxidoreductase [Dyella]TBR39008.1 NAD(P)-dependent oxidoreductase [Dyella terrae]TCI13400.1 NAD(P)-dependent oxidoreductase [Dyella soli]